MYYRTGTHIKANTVGKGIRQGEIIKVLENTLVVYSGVHSYLVRKDEKNIKVVNNKQNINNNLKLLV